MRRLAGLALAFAGMVLAIEARGVAAAWWRGDIDPAGSDWLLLVSLPVLLGLWWRYLSPFGRCRGACLVPGDDGRNPDKPA